MYKFSQICIPSSGCAVSTITIEHITDEPYCSSQWRISRAVVTVVTKRFVLFCFILIPSPFFRATELTKEKMINIYIDYILYGTIVHIKLLK